MVTNVVSVHHTVRSKIYFFLAKQYVISGRYSCQLSERVDDGETTYQRNPKYQVFG